MTPSRRSSHSHGSKERADIDDVIHREFDFKVYYDIPYVSFIERLLLVDPSPELATGLKLLNKDSRTVLESHYDFKLMRWDNLQNHHEKSFLPAVKEIGDQVSQYVNDQVLQDKSVAPTPSFPRMFFIGPTTFLKGRGGQRKMDIGVTQLGKKGTSWKDVEFVGEHALSRDLRKDKRRQLSTYARQAMLNQPTRRFIIGFLFVAHTLEVHFFDRCGALGSERFEFDREPELFAKVILALLFMKPSIAGDDVNVKKLPGSDDVTDKYVFTLSAKDDKKEYYTDIEQLTNREHLVGRGTTVWVVKSCSEAGEIAYNAKPCILKDYWRPEHQVFHEQMLYERAMEKKIPGLAIPKIFDNVKQNQLQDTTENNRRQLLQEFPRRPSRLSKDDTAKRSRTASSRSSSRSTPISLTPLQDMTNDPSYVPQPRLHCRILFQTVGKPLADVLSKPKDFFGAIRDAMQAHHDLHAYAGIIHRDVSDQNILAGNPWTELSEHVQGRQGFLIDLDYALLADNHKGLQERSGLPEFMAIHTLAGKGIHTYRRDLESFFYVVLWMIVGREHLERWCVGTYTTIAAVKQYDIMSAGNEFEQILVKVRWEYNTTATQDLLVGLRDCIFEGYWERLQPVSGTGTRAERQEQAQRLWLAKLEADGNKVFNGCMRLLNDYIENC